MSINLKQTAIIAMDLGSSNYLDDYEKERAVNEKFIEMLSEKLLDLKTAGSKLVSSNFFPEIHPGISVKFDYSTTDLNELMIYLKNNNISNVVYLGFHYPVCTHNGRPTSSYFLKKECEDLDVYVCPFLTRPLYRLQGGIPPSDNQTTVRQIML